MNDSASNSPVSDTPIGQFNSPVANSFAGDLGVPVQFTSFDYFLYELSSMNACDIPVPEGFLPPTSPGIIVWTSLDGNNRAIACTQGGTVCTEVAAWKAKDVTLKVNAIGIAPYYRIVKAVCERCRCLAVIAGHHLRCVIPGSTVSQSQTSTMRRLAWFGDALHILDVRIITSRMCDEDKDLVNIAEAYIKREAQAEYITAWINADRELSYAPLGPSVSQLSQAFEANYIGTFRETYLMEMFPGQEFADITSLASVIKTAL